MNRHGQSLCLVTRVRGRKTQVTLEHCCRLAVVLLLLITGCSQHEPQMTSEEARSELGHLNVSYSESSFIDSARNGDTVAVDLFLKAGMDPDARDSNGRLSCDFPDSRPNDELAPVMQIQKQLNDLAAISHRERSTTALMAASTMGRAKVVQRLLDGGASCELTDRLDMTALMYAAWRGHSAAVKVLLQAGANPAWNATKLDTNVVKAALKSQDPETISAIGTGEPRSPSPNAK